MREAWYERGRGPRREEELTKFPSSNPGAIKGARDSGSLQKGKRNSQRREGISPIGEAGTEVEVSATAKEF